MKITIKENIVEFFPEKPEETKGLEQLWTTVVECNHDSKKLAPIGEYIPVNEDKAAFVIEL